MMTFDVERFRCTSLSPRQATVPVPDLAGWFAEGIELVWTVRGLTGEEIARANEASARQAKIAAALQAMMNSAAAKPEMADAMGNIIGYGTDTPEDLVKRFDHLTFGSVQPVIDRAIAVKLFADYPIVAYTLTHKILELTGLGPDLGK